MIKSIHNAVFLQNNKIVDEKSYKGDLSSSQARENTLTYRILRSHDISDEKNKMRIKFDKLISHDITYVGIIQTARASGMTKFDIPYALTNCHNSLCAVGGTINEDDHLFGLSAAQKYGGIYVPANQAVIHQYAREEMAFCTGMILGSDSHTRYGAYGCMGVGEGGPELVKQLLGSTWDIDSPKVVLVYLKGAPPKGVGPHDVALLLCKEVFESGFVKNCILEFAGEGVANLSAEYRMAIDVMTTETSCLSSIWETDDKIKKHYETLGRIDDYKELKITNDAYYDKAVVIDLDKVEPMIALPFHPSNAYTIREFNENASDILHETEIKCRQSLGDNVEFNLMNNLCNNKFTLSQGVIAGCSGGMYETITEAASILKTGNMGSGAFSLSVYPASVPISLALLNDGITKELFQYGALVKPSFCGPCFGAGDTPANNSVSIRHTTRNFANREGSKPNQGQIASVILMDGRSIAATAARGGILTSAADVDYDMPKFDYKYDNSSYKVRCYNGVNMPKEDTELIMGPNIADWPKMDKLKGNMLIKLCAVIHDDVTTTDELIPSGETSSYRSNPEKLSEFALSRRVPEYVSDAKKVREEAKLLSEGNIPEDIKNILAENDIDYSDVTYGSGIFAVKPGDGSAREQAASCQKVLGGCANICYEFATKRYRSNCINWGMIPFTLDKNTPFDYKSGDYILVENVKEKIESGEEVFPAKVISSSSVSDITLYVNGLTQKEKEIILEGCLINYYGKQSK